MSDEDRLIVTGFGSGAYVRATSVRSRRTRSSVGGWVVNRFLNCMSRPVNGLTMNNDRVGRVDVHRHLLRVGVDLLQCAGERFAVPEQFGTAAVGFELTRAGERRLEEHRGDRGEQHHQQGADHVATLVVVATAEERTEHRDPRDEHDRHRHGRGNRRDQDVAVTDVGDLVGEHATELALVDDLEETLGDGDGRVLAGCGRWRKRSAAARR